MDSEKYRKAKKRVKKKKEFRDHIQSFIMTNIIMLGMGMMFGFFRAWLYVVFFWGIGMVVHYVEVYGFPGFENDEDWEKRELERELQNMEPQDPVEKNVQEEHDPDDFLDLDLPQPAKRKNYKEDDFV